MTKTNAPTRKELLDIAKRKGLIVKPHGKINGSTAYRVEGRQGIFSKQGLAELVGF